MRLGYACMNVTLGTKMRTCRLANATPERVEALARENLASVREMARWNARHGIRMLRLSSDIVPFAGRPEVAPRVHDALDDAFRETGRVLRAADQRVSAHPGQFTVLNSPRPQVVDAAVRDLAAQADWFDRMAFPRADLVIHLGGAYGDRDAAKTRFVDVASRVPESVLRKLVVENDDVTWPVPDVVDVSDATGLPVVFDALHDAVLPAEGTPRERLAACLATWPRGRKPKVHYSDQAPAKRPGAHAPRVEPARFRAWLAAHADLRAFDVMVEAKDKEQAVLPLLDAVHALA